MRKERLGCSTSVLGTWWAVVACSITLLFRAELSSALEASNTDSAVIAELKANMRAGFGRRFPGK